VTAHAARQTPAQLVDRARLADARITANQGDRAFSGRRAARELDQRSELPLAADETWAVQRGRDQPKTPAAA
jgi:hypothetical protein